MSLFYVAIGLIVIDILSISVFGVVTLLPMQKSLLVKNPLFVKDYVKFLIIINGLVCLITSRSLDNGFALILFAISSNITIVLNLLLILFSEMIKKEEEKFKNE